MRKNIKENQDIAEEKKKKKKKKKKKIPRPGIEPGSPA
jgi:hypothetical protein